MAGAGWIAFSTYRKKPQLKTQLTHYLPNKGGSHDFKFGFEVFEDSYRYGHNGRSGPIRYSYAGADASQSPDRIRFIDTGDPAGYGTDWTVGPTTDRHYAGYAQDRWSPNDNLTFTLGVRLDYQRVGYGDADPEAAHHRRPSSRRETNVAAATLVKNTNIAPRLGVTYDLTGKGRTVLKAFYGRYYNNIADSFTGANPAGYTHRGVQLPRPEPQWPLRRAVGTRHGAPAIRRQLDGGRSRLQDAVDRGDQRVVRDPAAGRVLGARDLRAEERPRRGAVLRQQPGPGVGRTEHGARDQDHRR